ncbi:MAG: ABC transporter ATP-binding protein [Candidatus Acidiferrales bacterium]
MKFSREVARLLGYVRPHIARLTAGVILLAIVGLSEGLVALMLIPAVDVVLNPHSTQQKLALVTLPLGGKTIYLNSFFPHSIHYVWTVFSISLFVLFIIKAIAEFAGTVMVQYVGHAAIMDLRNRVYTKLIQQPMGFFQHNPTGRVMSAVINDVEQMRSAFSEYLADFFRQSFALITFILVLLILNWKLALGSAIFIPLVIGPVSNLGRKIRKSSEKSRSRLADLSQIVQETMSGNRVVKAFGMERFEIGKFVESARQLLRENMRWVRAYAATSPIMDVLSAVVFAILILYARAEINHNVMTLGQFVAFVYSLFKVYEPVKRLGGIYQLFQQAIGASAVVFQFIDLPEEVQEAPGAMALPRFSREVKFEGVSFAYETGPAILRNIDLTVRVGSVMAIVGSSGAGKTTLVNLLPRFHGATSGSLQIDGHEVQDVTLRSLREQMAIVTQETILFNDTVWNNLCYGRPDMPEARVIAASKAALAHDFITQLPQGYQTRIGDRGQRLSGGQRQRLAIARALLKDAPILILDEATSELDSESEMLVQRALNNLMSGRTVFVIAHRLSTIRRADVIAVLDGGSICELGTHEQLLASGGTYRRLYEMQFLDADLDVPAPGPM